MCKHSKTPKEFICVAMLGLVATFILAGCQTAKSTSPPPDETANKDTPEAVTEREEMTVKVEGANASQSGDTLTIDYPVLEDINLRIPDWVINPAIGGIVGAVGVSSKKGLGVREQLDEARLSGRLELASMLETRVQTVGRSALEENQMATGEGRNENSRRNTLGIDRDILDLVLAGSRQRALWFDPSTGECYVWMVLDGAVLTQAKHYVIEDLSIFIANQPIKNEYKPERKQAKPPTVIVEAAAPAAPAPKEPVEKLEDSLKPIESVPIDSTKK
jgi:hypothetical protein